MSEQMALVTGASRGIGHAIAHELAGRGYALILNARSETALQPLADELSGLTDVTLVPGDLATVEGRAAVVHYASACDVLINNAGIGAPAMFRDTQAESSTAIIDVNVQALLQLSHAALPGMLERGRGRIMNVTSVAAFGPVPNMAVYAASKAFVLSFTEALSEELLDTGVTLTALCPGITATDMTLELRKRMQDLPAALVASPEEVARIGVNAMFKREVVCVPGFANQAAAELGRLPPRGVVRRIAGFAARLGLLER